MGSPEELLHDLVRGDAGGELSPREQTLAAAWHVRLNARILGKTQVGAAVLSDEGEIYVGCNVEHRYRSHDVHAEVNALTSMVAQGRGRAAMIAVVSAREQFTPCGGCMDWIFELGGPRCEVIVANLERITDYTAEQLMPHYPS